MNRNRVGNFDVADLTQSEGKTEDGIGGNIGGEIRRTLLCVRSSENQRILWLLILKDHIAQYAPGQVTEMPARGIDRPQMASH